jgi:hypothetical protein
MACGTMAVLLGLQTHIVGCGIAKSENVARYQLSKELECI